MTGKTKKGKKNKKVKDVRFSSRITVHKIEPHNASEYVQKIKTMNGPVLYHMPGCMHCTMMRPDWIKTINELKNKKVQCQILEVNSDALPMIKHPLAEHAQQQGFPRLINMQNGKEKDVFSDDRTVSNMLQFVLKHLKNKHHALPYDYNLNEKGNIKELTDPNNIKRVRKFNNPYNGKTKVKTRKNNTRKNKRKLRK
jgi:hypothetical protein